MSYYNQGMQGYNPNQSISSLGAIGGQMSPNEAGRLPQMSQMRGRSGMMGQQAQRPMPGQMPMGGLGDMQGMPGMMGQQLPMQPSPNSLLRPQGGAPQGHPMGMMGQGMLGQMRPQGGLQGLMGGHPGMQGQRRQLSPQMQAMLRDPQMRQRLMQMFQQSKMQQGGMQ